MQNSIASTAKHMYGKILNVPQFEYIHSVYTSVTIFDFSLSLFLNLCFSLNYSNYSMRIKNKFLQCFIRKRFQAFNTNFYTCFISKKLQKLKTIGKYSELDKLFNITRICNSSIWENISWGIKGPSQQLSL